MKKRTILLMMGCQLAFSMLMAQPTPGSQMEKLDRGVVALPRSSGSGNFVSWRLLGTDNKATTTFDVIRDGETVATGLTVTNYQDAGGAKGATYQVVTRVDGEVTATSQPVQGWILAFLPLTLDRPGKGEQGGTYTPNDMSLGDVDGEVGPFQLERQLSKRRHRQCLH